MNHQQLWVEPIGGIITARIRGKCSEEILRECQDRVIVLAKDTLQVKVLYDALEMEDPGVHLAIVQQNMDSEAWKEFGSMPLRRAILVPNSRIAFLARLAFGQFGEGSYRVFYNDLTQAVLWLEEKV